MSSLPFQPFPPPITPFYIYLQTISSPIFPYFIKKNILFINLAQVQNKKGQIVSGLTRGIEGLFGKNKVKHFKGLGTLAANNAININLNDGSKTEISAKNIIIATGSEPNPFPGIPFDEKRIVSSTGLPIKKKKSNKDKMT